MLDQPDSEARDLFGTKGAARRLRSLTKERLEPGEDVLAWARVWLSRDRRHARLLSARTPSFAVLTTRRVLCWSTGFFSRMPRHRIITDRLDDLTVDAIGEKEPLRQLRVRAFARKALRFDFHGDDRGQQFAAQLCDQVEDRKRGPLPPLPIPPLPTGLADPSKGSSFPKDKESKWRR